MTQLLECKRKLIVCHEMVLICMFALLDDWTSIIKISSAVMTFLILPRHHRVKDEDFERVKLATSDDHLTHRTLTQRRVSLVSLQFSGRYKKFVNHTPSSLQYDPPTKGI